MVTHYRAYYAADTSGSLQLMVCNQEGEFFSWKLSFTGHKFYMINTYD